MISLKMLSQSDTEHELGELYTDTIDVFKLGIKIQQTKSSLLKLSRKEIALQRMSLVIRLATPLSYAIIADYIIMLKIYCRCFLYQVFVII